GKCEVVLYSPEHNGKLTDLSGEHLKKLAELWTERFNALSADENIKYVFIFENRGEVVGVTMPHPHGQIYGYSFIPKKIALEIDSAAEYYNDNGKCLFCDMLDNEREFGKRIIFENEHFTVFLPFFTEYPYGVYIMPRRHVPTIAALNDDERAAFAVTVKDVVGMLDSLFDYSFPYMMCMHNAPVNSGNFDENYHFHIEFFPPMRSADKQKFNASSETGVWAHCNPTCPEATSEELRAAFAKFKSK
ncbi:MAG: galactose-1-phosphate uridylyltransferase, partial [Oscillospiraceae bacterium]|nr:galactose-1-phosphate uridylyltransferase [Oscillospiraceae bacterium]